MEQQVVFYVGEFDRLASDLDLTGIELDGQVVGDKWLFGPAKGKGLAPADDGLDPGEELDLAEWLGYIVVGTPLQSLDDVLVV